MTVPPEWEDRNGHVNVQYYLGLYERGGWGMLDKLGFDEQYMAGTMRSIFDLENHLTYLSEIHVGDTVSTHNRMLSRSDKIFHGMFLIVNDTNNELAATVEYLSLFIDMERRKSTPFPEEMTIEMDKLALQHAS